MWLLDEARERWRKLFLSNKTAVGIDVNCKDEDVKIAKAIENDKKKEEEEKKTIKEE